MVNIMSIIIDLSQRIEHKMPIYPGDIETSLIQTKSLSSDYYNNHTLQTGMHTGTHIDAPMHLTDSKEYISDLPLDLFIGVGCVLDVRGRRIINMEPEYEELVKQNSILLLYTGWDRLYGTKGYYKDYPVVDKDFCDLMLRKNIKMLGLDMPSPDKYPFPIHKMLMEQGIVILENLANLGKLLDAHRFEVIALPLKIRADGSLTRAVARILQPGQKPQDLW